MKILFIGDVVASAGCEFVRRVLPEYRKQNNIDLVIINGENSADGNGITPFSAAHLFDSGADVITGGNHTLRRREVHPVLDENPFLLRPDNIKCDYGSGYCLVDMGRAHVAVVNLAGVIYMDEEHTANPFTAANALIDRAKGDRANIIIVDFHAEATSEKRALGIYLDGRVSAVIGTHTHTQTADEQIQKNGTAYITDAGMTGPEDSVLGVESSIIISRLKDKDMSKFITADTPCFLCGVQLNIDEKTGKATDISRVVLRR